MRPRNPCRLPGRIPNAIAACGCAVLLGLASCGRQKESVAAEPVAARIDEEVILVSDVAREIAARLERGAIVPAKEALLEDMVERRILVRKALAAGLDQDPEVARAFENLLIGRYKEEHLAKDSRNATVSDEEIVGRYEANPQRFQRGAKARLAILKLELPPTLGPEEKEEKIASLREARNLAAQATDGPGFGKLALRYSEDDVTRNRGGDAGWLDEGVPYRWPERVVQTGFALSTGEISEALVEADAVYLVKKLDERAPASVVMAQVRDQLRREIQTEKLRTVDAAFDRQIREGVVIETFPESLSGLQVPMPVANSRESEQTPPGIP